MPRHAGWWPASQPITTGYNDSFLSSRCHNLPISRRWHPRQVCDGRRWHGVYNAVTRRALLRQVALHMPFFRSYLLLVKWRVLRGILPGFYTLIYILGALAWANGRTGRPPADLHTQPKYPPHTRVHPVAVDPPYGLPEFIHDSSWLQGPILSSVRSSCGWSSFTIRFVGATFRKWKYINRLVF